MGLLEHLYVFDFQMLQPTTAEQVLPLIVNLVKSPTCLNGGRVGQVTVRVHLYVETPWVVIENLMSECNKVSLGHLLYRGNFLEVAVEVVHAFEEFPPVECELG